MNYQFIIVCFLVSLCSCKSTQKTVIPTWEAYDESAELAQNAAHKNGRMQYKLIQSKISDKNDLWSSIQNQISDFTEDDYINLKPLILEQDILTIQQHIRDNKLSYEGLAKWYLYRIAKFENDKDKTLHSIIALNPNAVVEAIAKDKNKTTDDHPMYGMPILLKDNINTKEMKTTAGAAILKDNQTGDAFIVDRLRSKGAIILGKANLSEWAYYLCNGCPLGYSAVGGQTLNPYGRMKFETGGSSAGSGTTTAANYAVAAVGTETSGSILSPSSQNSVVGLKPTIGLLSRSGIVPISSTLDTPGPMTRSVIDNAIFLDAMLGFDKADAVMTKNANMTIDIDKIRNSSLRGIRLGANKSFMETDSLYRTTVQFLQSSGIEVIEFDPVEVSLKGFLSILDGDMKVDLPKYLAQETSSNITVRSVKEIVDFNRKDTLINVPYGQSLFEGIVDFKLRPKALNLIKSRLEKEGRKYFDTPMAEHNLDAVLSINNYNAAFAAVAKYPCLTIPMGYKASGEPSNLTFTAKQFEEHKLLEIGYAYEKLRKSRKMPNEYR